MEKLVYLLWKTKEAREEWCPAMQSGLASAMQQAGARRVRFNLADRGVEEAMSMRQAFADWPLPDVVVTFWLDSAHCREAVEALLTARVARLAGYSVCESEPLPNTRHPAPSGERCYGMNHVVFLQIPPRLQREEWLALWLAQHTAVAIETQQTFGYRQNVVVRSLTPDAPAIDAIVEENFPPEAMADQDAFYVRDTPEQLRINQKRMYQSVCRFIDMDKMARLPTSQYDF